MSMDPDDKFVLRISGGCCLFLLFVFAAVIFTVAAAIKWVLA